MSSDPVTIKIVDGRLAPSAPPAFDWEIWIGDYDLVFEDLVGSFAQRSEAMADALNKLRALRDALQVGVRDEDGEPLDHLLYD
ncbi:MAG: hypothetical protein OXR82_17485 [Gammaproteobacteria bacterium]|nr:hypothetical protein [Gammaproteobacteria bacterium]